MERKIAIQFVSIEKTLPNLPFVAAPFIFDDEDKEETIRGNAYLALDKMLDVILHPPKLTEEDKNELLERSKARVEKISASFSNKDWTEIQQEIEKDYQFVKAKLSK